MNNNFENPFYRVANVVRDQLTQHLVNGDNFVLIRYGDGEFINMTTTNYNDHNCDGNLYYKEQGQDLEKSLRFFCRESQSNQKIYIGIWVDCAINPQSL